MAVEIVCLRSGHAVSNRKARGATHITGAALQQMLSLGTFFVQFGSLSLSCIAVRMAAHYEIPASAFRYTSQDGTFIAINDLAFSGGQLVPSGIGTGTTIVPIQNTDPCPTSINIQDVSVSG